MGAPPAVDRFLSRVEADLAATGSDVEGVVVAFSGGLASLVLAALVRKRTEMRCVVVATGRSADAEAARVAQTFLDYPVDVLVATPEEALRAACDIAAREPRLSVADVLSLVPLAFVASRYPGERVLSGFAFTPRSAALHRQLARAEDRPPGMRLRDPRPPSRTVVLAMARELAIPDAFARSSRRSPSEGSGIGPALRALGHSRHTSVTRLVRPVI